MSYMSERERVNDWRVRICRIVLELGRDRPADTLDNPMQFDADIKELESVVESGGHL